MLRVKNNPMSTCSITQRCIFSKFATIVPFLFPRKLSHSVSASLQQVKLLCWQPCRITISIPAQIESSKWDLTCAVESANRMLWLCMRKKVGTIFAKFERKHLRLVVYESFGHPILFLIVATAVALGCPNAERASESRGHCSGRNNLIVKIHGSERKITSENLWKYK